LTEELFGGDSANALLNSIADECHQNPEAECADNAAERKLIHWLQKLSQQQRVVVELRYGLHGHGRQTLEQVGRVMGVTRERVRQIQLSALKRLREVSREEGYAEIPFMDGY
jgi:RNA polymerase nonessential primary-like sigma factor